MAEVAIAIDCRATVVESEGENNKGVLDEFPGSRDEFDKLSSFECVGQFESCAEGFVIGDGCEPMCPRVLRVGNHIKLISIFGEDCPPKTKRSELLHLKNSFI